MSGIDVIIEDLSTHPSCVHGPTLLFSREIDGHKRFYYACSACRDRKKCSFFVWKDELEKYVNKKINKQILEHQKSVNHRQLFLKLNKVKAASENQRIYCNTCDVLTLKDDEKDHEDHDLKNGVTDYELEHPSEFLKPLDDSKKEAQYLFSEKCVKHIVEMLQDLGKKNVICIGTPRIFEYINSNMSLGMNAILLDFDSRYNLFFGPLQFCWYNLFNNHFFRDEAREVFREFLKSTNVSDTIVITDPPFGGRVEPISDTLCKIDDEFKKVHKSDKDLPIFWIFPYFMEHYILNFMENFAMLDYKVDYDNHPLFQKGDGGRKFGSPVRIFTNLEPSSVTLPLEEGYKYCSVCERWVGEENKHCKLCGKCTSKDGRTYIHCNICEKCVKPSWMHCKKCKKCANESHRCEQLPFTKNCLHCKQPGHKKVDCPDIIQDGVTKTRRSTEKTIPGNEQVDCPDIVQQQVTKKRKSTDKRKSDNEKIECPDTSQQENKNKRRSTEKTKADNEKVDCPDIVHQQVSKKRKSTDKRKSDNKKVECPDTIQEEEKKKRKSTDKTKPDNEEVDCPDIFQQVNKKRKSLEKTKPDNKMIHSPDIIQQEVTKKRKSTDKTKNKTKKLKNNV